jgi:hypothetical protein
MVTDQGFVTGNLLKQNHQLCLSKDNNRRTKGMQKNKGYATAYG